MAAKTKVPAQRVSGKPVTVSVAHGAAETAELASVLDDITALLTRYVVYPDVHSPRVLALKCVQTWCRNPDGTMFFPDELYIAVNGKSGSGKTRVLKTVRPLVCMPGEITSRPTEAVTFRITASNEVLFIEEIQRALAGLEKNGIESVLTTGYQRGGYVERVDPASKTERLKFPTFGPKFIDGINLYRVLADDIQRRCYFIDMPYLPYAWETHKIADWNIDEYERHAVIIRQRCQAWFTRHGHLLGNRSPVIPRVPGAHREMWQSLLTLAELAGPTWAGYARDALTDSLSDDGISTDSATIKDAIRTAVNRGYIRLTDYDDRKSWPPVCGDRETAGWKRGVKGDCEVSVKSDDTGVTLRFDKTGATYVWSQVLRANQGIILPSKIEDSIRILREDKQATTDGPRALTVKERVWKTDTERHGIFCINIHDWFNRNETEQS